MNTALRHAESSAAQKAMPPSVRLEYVELLKAAAESLALQRTKIEGTAEEDELQNILKSADDAKEAAATHVRGWDNLVTVYMPSGKGVNSASS